MGWISNLGSIVGAVTGIGSLIQGNKQNHVAQDQFNANMDLAQNRHQYEVKDLKAAGLNPILSANGGNQPLVGSTAGAMTDPYSKAMANVASALQLGTISSQIEKNKADANLADAQTALTNRDTKLKEDVSANIQADTEYKKAQTQNCFSQQALNEANVKLVNQHQKNAVTEGELLMKKLQYYDMTTFASLNLAYSQAQAAVAAGRASEAQAAASYQYALTSARQRGLIDAQEQETLARAAGVVFDNTRKDYEIRKAKSSEWADTNPLLQNAASIGRVAQDVGKGLGSFGEAIGGTIGSIIGR